MSGWVERVAVAALALAVSAGLAVACSAARAGGELRDLQLSTPHPNAADLLRARERFDAAGRLTPGERRTILLADLRFRGGDAAGARRLLLPAVRREPDDAELWLRLAQAAREQDPQLARRALQRVRELVPPVPPP